jgi:hypothetical protein
MENSYRLNLGGYYHPSGDRQGSVRTCLFHLAYPNIGQISFRGAHFLQGDVSVFDASVSILKSPVPPCHSHNIYSSSLSPPTRRKPSILSNECSWRFRTRQLKTVRKLNFYPRFPTNMSSWSQKREHRRE